MGHIFPLDASALTPAVERTVHLTFQSVFLPEDQSAQAFLFYKLWLAPIVFSDIP